MRHGVKTVYIRITTKKYMKVSDPTKSELLRFGLIVFAGMTVVAVYLWITDGYAQARWFWAGTSRQIASVIVVAAGTLVLFSSIISLGVGKVIYKTWITGATALGTCLTFFVLTLMYFLVLPVFSLIRFRDPLRLKLLGNDETYWEDHRHHESTLERSQRLF